MRKTVMALMLILSLSLIGCANIQPNLKGSYQSDTLYDGYIIQMAFQPDGNSFVEYIDNVEVDRGTYEKVQDNIYQLKSDKQNFEISLDTDNTFELAINQINQGEPIRLENLDDIPTYYTSDVDDVDMYKDLLEDGE